MLPGHPMGYLLDSSEIRTVSARVPQELPRSAGRTQVTPHRGAWGKQTATLLSASHRGSAGRFLVKLLCWVLVMGLCVPHVTGCRDFFQRVEWAATSGALPEF